MHRAAAGTDHRDVDQVAQGGEAWVTEAAQHHGVVGPGAPARHLAQQLGGDQRNVSEGFHCRRPVLERLDSNGRARRHHR
jgi:hypothetical protein